jgi:AraC family transcriptional regulator of adaptative response / DNA-3-methyladenine glycosylase II
VAFASGFASVRQFNDTVKAVFARNPTELRRAAAKRADITHDAKPTPSSVPNQTISLRLAYREPFSAASVFGFLALRAVPGTETFEGDTYTKSLRLANGDGVVSLTPADGYVRAEFSLADLRDLTTAVSRCRHLLNLDSDPKAVDEALSRDPLLRPLVRRNSGLRVPGATDGFELATRALIGQQVSVSGARTIAGRLAAAAGTPLSNPVLGVSHTFPTAQAIAELASRSPAVFSMPSSRRRALQTVAEAVADDKMTIDPGTDPAELDSQLLSIAGVGPWTSSYILMRALGDPDAFMPTDLGLRRAAAALGEPDDPSSLTKRAESWRPWRSYAMCHLWAAPVHQDRRVNEGIPKRGSRNKESAA